MKINYLLLSSLIIFSPIYAQEDSTFYNFGDFGGIILLDSIVVSASRNSLNIEDFIDMVRTDESFYKAFINLRRHSYSADNQIKMYNKKNKVKANYFSKTIQIYEGKCRTMKFFEEDVKGNFYKKKKKHRYYTAKMYDHLFFIKGKVCSVETVNENNTQSKGIDKHVVELKKLIFNPGEKTDVPLIGKKTKIFSKEMAKYYDFSITSNTYKDSIDCYVFGVIIKPEYVEKKKDKTVIKTLETYFEKSNFQVIARDYTLAYQGTFFDFDINMKIELKKVDDYYVPEYIEYDGRWDVPMKKPEISIFHARFYNFQ